MLLTEYEIATIGQELAAANNVSDIDFARAIEASVLAKLREQEPVAWTDKTGYVWPNDDKHIKSNMPLYLHPAPIPEGMALVPIEKLNAFLSSVNGDCYMGQTWEATEVYQFRAILEASRSE